MAECQNCELEKRTAKLEQITENQEVRIEKLEEDVRKNSEQRKVFYDKFDKLALDNQKHEMNIQNIFEKLDSIAGKTNEIDRKVDEINNRPAKTAGKFSDAIISAIGGAVGTGFVAVVAAIILMVMK